METKVNLGPEDPTIFAKCPVCNKTGKGVKIGDIFGKAYTPRRWKRDPECENCGGKLIKVFEVGNE